ncbi:MAG: hypothetical protein N3A54_04705, partial [Patescibacteria group bacterium]|nr:hypothetical protein [Patescibacteria group bacterium]
MLNKPLFVCILFSLLGILAYFPSFFGSFVWDDYDFIVDNQYVTTNRIDKFFTAQAVEGTGRISNYYRPIQFTLYAVTYRLFGTNPHAFHALSIAFHIGASAMVCYFLRSLSVTRLLSFLIAILFLIHPLQTEAVSYISGLSDPLVGFFGFATLVSFLNKQYLLSIPLFILTLLSKESGLVFLGILLMLTVVYKKKQTLPIIFLFCLITLLYLLYHKTVIHIIDMRTVFGDSPYTYSVFVRLSTFLSILPNYLALIVFPKDLFYDRDFFVRILSTPWHLPSFIVLGLMITISSIVLHSKKPIAIISFLSCFIALLPFSGIVLINGIMYE